MNRYRRHCLFLAMAIFTLSGCATTYNAQPVCRHTAVFAALAYGEQFPVRIARGPHRPGEYHAQAQAKIDGEWRWLNTSRCWILPGGRDDFEPETYFSLEEYLDRVVMLQKR